MALVHQSDISAWIRCPTAFMHSKQGHPRKQLSATAYGSVVHNALETFERLRHTPGIAFADATEAAVQTFLHYWHPLNIDAICPPVDVWIPRQGYNDLRQRGIENIRAYCTLVKDDEHELLATEFPFLVPIDGTWDDDLGQPHELAGSIDRLAVRFYKRKPILCIDDYKTGKEYRYLRQNLQFSAYCHSPETPVLMADMTWRRIDALKAGDKILGVDEHPGDGAGGPRRIRRWRETTIENTWGVVKQAYRLHLTDGTSVVAGAGHQFLAQREGGWAWRTVEDMMTCLDAPARKSPGIRISRILPPASSFEVDTDSVDYMAGYIAGATLGDGSVRSRAEQRPYWTIGLGTSDLVLLDRLRRYLCTFGIKVNSFEREPDGRGWQRSHMSGLTTGCREYVEAIEAMGANPSDSDEYAAGWLAGLYDTDGGLNERTGALTFYQKDSAVLESVVKRAHQLGFEFRIGRKANGLYTQYVAVLVGDRTQRATFTAIIRPALERKVATLPGRSVRIFTDVRVREIEDLGPQRLIDVTTGTGTYIADGLISHNCYASTKIEFWTGWQGEDGFGPERGTQLHERFKNCARRGTWINLRQVKLQDAGWRGPQDYRRFALAVEQIVASMKADIYPMSLSGETCQYCEFREICAGDGVPANEHGAPSG